MSDYVPSIGMARARYCDSIVRKDGVPHSFVVTPEEHAKNHAEFDRMIASVERAAAEKAWGEGTRAQWRLGQVRDVTQIPDNPYRAAALVGEVAARSINEGETK